MYEEKCLQQRGKLMGELWVWKRQKGIKIIKTREKGVGVE